ncbi:MAG: hypothetical protein ACR2MN_07170 [Acidimicrobiales bacterium]
MTTTTPASTPTTRAIQRERLGKAMLSVAVVGAVASALGAISAVVEADGPTKILETWRLYGLIVFAGLFTLLAIRPHHYRGVWELILFSKLALTGTAVAYAIHGGIPGTASIIGWDGGLSLVLITAYICCRGWTAGPRQRGPSQ